MGVGGGAEKKSDSQLESTPAPGTGTKTRMVKVSQEYIDWLKATPYKPFRGVPQHLLDGDDDDDEDGGESLRDLMARVAARHREVRDRDLDILAQYDRCGFAEIEVVVSDDDGDMEEMAMAAAAGN